MMRKCVRVLAVIPITLIICMSLSLLMYLVCDEDIKWGLIALNEGIELIIIGIVIIHFMKITEKLKLVMK